MIEPIIGNNNSVSQDLIKDTTTENFMSDVIEPSKDLPVLVDFWAPWCEPCKQLTPIIEKIIKNADGKVKLVKLNIDDHPEIPQQLQIQSIPAVFAFKDGQPVDAFVGVQSESQIKAFIEKQSGSIGPSPIDQAIEAAEVELENSNYETAINIFQKILEADSSNLRAISGLVKSYIGNQDLTKAKEILKKIPQKDQENQYIKSVKAELSLIEIADELDDISDLKIKLEKNPEDFKLIYELAIAHISHNNHEDAINYLLKIIKKDKNWNDGAAKEQLLKLFEVLGNENELTINGRRALSSLIFS
ncbi:thioredoxin [Alphaproteobacteria bacterium]|nr:thioredoxin [Alphaproteobacteria bacterium]